MRLFDEYSEFNSRLVDVTETATAKLRLKPIKTSS